MRYQSITPILLAQYVASATIRPGPRTVPSLDSALGPELGPRQYDGPFSEQLSPGPFSPGPSSPDQSPAGPFSGPFSGPLIPNQSPPSQSPPILDQLSPNQPFRPEPLRPEPLQPEPFQPQPFQPQPIPVETIPDERPSKRPPQADPFLGNPLPEESFPNQPYPGQPFTPNPEPTVPEPALPPKPEPEPSLKPIPTPILQPDPEPTPSLEPVFTLKPTTILNPQPKPTFLPEPEPESPFKSTTTQTLTPEPVFTLKPITTLTLEPEPTSTSKSTTTQTPTPEPVFTLKPITTLTLEPEPTSTSKSTTSSTTSSTTTSTTSSTTTSTTTSTPKPVIQPTPKPEPKVVVVDVLHSENREVGIPFQPLISMGFGTPSQVITGILDTGSSDLIIPKAGSVVCRLAKQQCQGSKVALGDYEPAKDRDVRRVANSGFAAGFQIGDAYNGPYISTSVSVGDAKVKAVQIGLAVNGSVAQNSAQFPVFGVGPISAEQTVDNGKYANLPQRMKDVGLINANLFSVWLNPTPFANGSVVFGGIDSTKFAGQLQTVPIEPDNSGKISGFVVRLSSVQLSMGGARGGQRNGRPQNRQSTSIDLGLGRSEGFTSVDTGTPFIVIPSGSMENLARALDTTFSEKDGLGLVNCQLASGDNSLIFGFNQGQTMLSVPLARTVISKEISKTSQTGGCALAIASAGQDDALNVMGYPFMSAVYTVFDRDSERIMFAQAV